MPATSWVFAVILVKKSVVCVYINFQVFPLAAASSVALHKHSGVWLSSPMKTYVRLAL